MNAPSSDEEDLQPYAQQEGFEVEDLEIKRQKEKKKQAKEEKNLSKVMLSKKKKRILHRINYGKNKKKQLVKKLRARKGKGKKDE